MHRRQRVNIPVILRIIQVKHLRQRKKSPRWDVYYLSSPLTFISANSFFSHLYSRCLDPALTIAAALSSKSPFITPFGHEAEAALAKASFRSGISIYSPCTFLTSVTTDDSDFLTIHNAFASWRRAHANGQSAARTLCKKSFLSYQVYIANINGVPTVSL
jgi:HrpA-like RNA helicase